MSRKFTFLFVFAVMLSVSLVASTIDFEEPNMPAMTGGALDFNADNSIVREGNKLGPRQTVVDSVPSPGGGTHMGLGWDGSYLWHVVNTPPIPAFQFDTINGTVISSIVTSIGSYILGLTYLNGSLWIQEWQTSGTIYEVDPVSGNTISSFVSPGGTGSRGLTSDGTDLWCFATGGSTNNGTAYQLTTGGSTVHSSDISGPIQWPMGASYNNQRGTHFVNDNSTANDINELDCSGATAVLVDEFAHPDAGNTPEGITYDGQFLWTLSFYGTWTYKIDIGDPPPAPPEAILYVDDDPTTSTATYWETSFGNIGYAFDKWVVADSGFSPDAAAMSAWTIVVWSTAGDYLTTLTASEVTEIGNWLAAGGKLWLASQDVLYDYGAPPWLHVSGWVDDVGCTAATGIGTVMNGTAFATTGAVFTDYGDDITNDGTSWDEVQNQTPVINSVALDTSTGEPYFLFFSAFGWENINAEADRDTMMQRILTWMGFLPPANDVGTQAIVWPPTSVLIDAQDYPSATYRNYGAQTSVFDVHFEIDDTSGNVYTGAVQTITLDPAASTTWVFTTQWTAGSVEGMVYDVTAYTVMPGDMDPGNDTLTQVTTTTSVSEWIQCADRPTPELCHATCYDPVGDYIYALGGGDGSSYVNWTYRYDPVNDSWASLAAMPSAINWIDASVTQWNRSIYVFGGYDGGFNNYNYIYDIVNDSWSTGPTMPAGRIAAGQCVYNDSLVYMLCGHTGGGASNSVYIYNTYTDTWTTGTNAPTPSFMQAVATTGDTLWLVMTYNGSSCNTTMYYGVPDPANCENITWSTGATLPVPNFNGGGTWLYRPIGEPPVEHAYIYEVGGFENAATITAHSWEYDVANDVWNALPDYPMTICRNDVLTYRRTATEAEIFVNGGDNTSGWSPTAQAWKLSWALPGAEEEKPTKAALVFGLNKVSPNPVNNGAVIAYATTQKGPVSLKLYDSSGRLIRTLIDKTQDAGRKTVYWNGKDNNNRTVSAGVYFYRLTAENKSVSAKIVIVR